MILAKEKPTIEHKIKANQHIDNLAFVKRRGNKEAIIDELLPLFPPHSVYIDLFMGTGAVFLHKPKVEYNFLNDLDEEITNLYFVLRENKDKLVEQIELMPVSRQLFNHWKTNKEENPIYRAVRFLMLSNFSFLGTGGTFNLRLGNDKKYILDKIDEVYRRFSNNNVRITNLDFRKLLKDLTLRHKQDDSKRMFIYADPPYLTDDSNKYKNCAKWSKDDTVELFEVLVNYGCKFAISEFDSEFVLELAKKHDLNINRIKIRQTLKNRRCEMLYTNYETERLLF